MPWLKKSSSFQIKLWSALPYGTVQTTSAAFVLSDLFFPATRNLRGGAHNHLVRTRYWGINVGHELPEAVRRETLVRRRVIAHLNFSKALPHPSQHGCHCPSVGRSRSRLLCSAHAQLPLEQLLKCPRERRGGRAVVHSAILFSSGLPFFYLIPGL